MEVNDWVYEFENFSMVVLVQLKLVKIIGFKFLFDFTKSALKVCSQNWPFEKLSFAFVDDQEDNW